VPATPAPKPAVTKAPPEPAATPKAKPGVPTATPMPSGPTTAGAPTGDASRGPRTEVHHGPTAKRELQLQWEHPVVASTGFARGEGTAVAEKTALTYADALRAIAGDDPRPLLVLRECSYCAGTDKALLLPGIDNERTILLARWFHLVKLPGSVVEPDHALHALFPDSSSGHMFLCQADGSGRIALESETSRPEFWASMTRVLTEAYGKDPTATTREMSKLLDRLDTLDARERELSKRRDNLLEASVRLDRTKLDQLSDEILEVQREAAKMLEQFGRIGKLDLLPRAAPAEVR